MRRSPRTVGLALAATLMTGLVAGVPAVAGPAVASPAVAQPVATLPAVARSTAARTTTTPGRVASARPSGPGVRDTLFPRQGHGGYNVLFYDVALHWAPAGGAAGAVRAVTTITARATHRQRSVTLDLSGLSVTGVVVDGAPARWHRHGHQLTITPARPIGGRFVARIRYRGVPHTITDADGSTEGWVKTADGAIGLGEPVGTMAWVPTDDTPGDKALWTFHVDVPSRLQVAANGDLVGRRHHGDRTTWSWRGRDPMAAYLATVAIGRFHVYHSRVTSITGRRIPVWSFVDRRLGTAATARAQLPSVLRFEERLFGPYPFSSTGMIVDDAHVGYALETQTRPFYPESVTALVHEMAHQWYGDSVSVVDWHDLWLAEGFATYAEWLHDAAHGGPSTQETYADLYAKPASDPLWRPAPTRFTSSADLFGDPVYERGAMTLQALRNRIGDHDFFVVLKDWARLHRHGNVRTADLLHLAERVSGVHLGGLFRDWLVRAGKPAGYR